jgi:hypothetical protein
MILNSSYLWELGCRGYTRDIQLHEKYKQNSAVASSIIGGGGGSDIHIFVFCVINFFWNRLFLWSVNTNIWISAPPQLSSLLRHWSRTSTFRAKALHLAPNFATKGICSKLWSSAYIFQVLTFYKRASCYRSANKL